MTAGNPDIDPDRLRRIGVLDDPAVAMIVERFLAILDDRIVAMTQAAAEGRTADLAKALYQLRGSAATCGFPGIADFCRRAEATPADFDPGQLRILAARAAAAMADFKDPE